MDLSQVKTAVKSWEKQFRRANGRDPTKEDIKRDPGDIAEQYALYRRLSKSSSSQGHTQTSTRTQPQSHQLPSSSSTSSSYSQSQHSRSTPRTIPSSEYPTTPTPPARRTASSRNLSQSAAGPSTLPPPPSLLNNGGPSTPSRSLKRTASKAALQVSPTSVFPPSLVPPAPSPSSASRNLFTTPKKVKGYSGPVYDPNPVNPFAIATPTKSSPSRSIARDADHPYHSGQGLSSFSSSPFIHASSPRKLKQVLEANSLRKVKEREMEQMKEVTPRTRARKRLRGEPVEDTPMKDKIPRRRRGDAQIGNGRNGSFLKVPGSAKTVLVGHEVEHEAEDEDDEDEMGPSPLKDVQGTTKSFSTLFTEAGAETKTAGPSASSTVAHRTTALASNGVVPDEIRRGRPSEMLGLFGQIGKSNKQKALHQAKEEKRIDTDNVALSAFFIGERVARSRSPSASPTPAPAPVISITDPEIDGEVSTADSPTRLPTPPPDVALEAAASQSQSTPSRAERREKVLSISDDEEDEWDPEGGRVVRRVVIVPTRRAVQRRNSESDYDHVEGSEDKVESAADEEEEEEEGHRSASPSLAGEGTTLSSTIPSPASSFAPTYLSMLSLTSPQAPRSRRRAELDDLRVKAIFDPVQAARLKAIKRGQDVIFSGEAGQSGVGGEDEDDILDAYDAGLIDENEEKDIGGGGIQGDDDWESESEGWKRTDRADGLDDEW